jgi:hypothetical protein
MTDEAKSAAICRLKALWGSAQSFMIADKSPDYKINLTLDHSLVTDAIKGVSTEVSEELCSADAPDATKALLQRAATSIVLLTKMLDLQTQLAVRDPNGGDGEPVEFGKAKVAEAIGHAAKAVGHGLCVRDAKHIGNCIDCLAAGIVDQPGPTGDPDPDELSFQVKKLEPKAGDIIVVQCDGADADGIKRLADELTEDWADLGVKAVVVNGEMAADIDASLASKVTELAELQSDCADLNAEIETLTAAKATLETDTAAKQAEFDELDAKIAALKAERLGRLSGTGLSRVLAARADSEVKPEHYYASQAEQREALNRMVRNGAEGPPSGRDLAATQ